MGIWDIFYPGRCVVCDRVLGNKEEGICKKCDHSLRYIGDVFCMKCGKPVTEEREFCKDCENKSTTFLYGRSTFLYNKEMRKSIGRFKYHGRCEYAKYYGKHMYEQQREWIEKIKPDALIPVPIHAKRRRKRGYNQAELLASELAKYTDIPMITDWIYRKENTLPQKELTAKQRLENLKSAFDVRNAELYINVNCVIIIDDIYTTGSTIEACSLLMRKIGVKEIYFLCLCSGQAD